MYYTFSLFPFSRFRVSAVSSHHGYYICTEQHEDGSHGLVPRKTILTDNDGNERSYHRLQVGVDAYSRGTEASHCKRYEEIA